MGYSPGGGNQDGLQRERPVSRGRKENCTSNLLQRRTVGSRISLLYERKKTCHLSSGPNTLGGAKLNAGVGADGRKDRTLGKN